MYLWTRPFGYMQCTLQKKCLVLWDRGTTNTLNIVMILMYTHRNRSKREIGSTRWAVHLGLAVGCTLPTNLFLTPHLNWINFFDQKKKELNQIHCCSIAIFCFNFSYYFPLEKNLYKNKETYSSYGQILNVKFFFSEDSNHNSPLYGKLAMTGLFR